LKQKLQLMSKIQVHSSAWEIKTQIFHRHISLIQVHYREKFQHIRVSILGLVWERVNSVASLASKLMDCDHTFVTLSDGVLSLNGMLLQSNMTAGDQQHLCT